ncbi:phage head completion protein [Alteriqipengyuania lutimaris]|uniref:Head-tail adaptor protein n=1 Tax=Alteriqipengyuania lutimaris TaxID=1538146 RepID=A0A395LKH1_9SPHN|nr:head-tail adaptor protein [Alteriqipengyuania lutimaris]MBB3035381.1 head-tail adaptor [Alteriqipengyuania lutimaris]RDS75964.1 hypothetical protein DL238_14935 [Alteriqipengyuania lutimaris]
MDGAAARDRKIVFRSNEPTESPTGEMVPDPGEPFATAMASVNYGKASERRQAGADSAEATATARVLSTEKTRAINADHIAELDEATWNVAGNVPWGRRHRDITLVRRA